MEFWQIRRGGGVLAKKEDELRLAREKSRFKKGLRNIGKNTLKKRNKMMHERWQLMLKLQI